MTPEEAEALIVEGARLAVRYWTTMVPEEMSVEDRVSGVAFTILAMLDGDGSIPRCEVVMIEDDDEGEVVGEVRVRGPLHDLFYAAAIR